jgi:hypothetical protein
MHFSLPISLALLATLSSVFAAPMEVIVIDTSAAEPATASYTHEENLEIMKCKRWCWNPPVCPKIPLDCRPLYMSLNCVTDGTDVLLR